MLHRISLLLVVLSLVGTSCKHSSKAVTDTKNSNKTDNKSDVKPVNKEPHYIVAIETTLGTIKVELYNNTPLHRDNFVKLVKEGFYDGTLFHRIIKGFMVQGGDPESKKAEANRGYGSGGPGYTVDAEFVADNVHFRGTLAAARMGDQVNPKKASSGSQFYIVQGGPVTDITLNGVEGSKGFTYTEAQRKEYKEVGGTPHLDRDYTVFGRITEGFEILDKIAAAPKAARLGDRPIEDIKMKMTIVSE